MITKIFLGIFLIMLASDLGLLVWFLAHSIKAKRNSFYDASEHFILAGLILATMTIVSLLIFFFTRPDTRKPYEKYSDCLEWHTQNGKLKESANDICNPLKVAQ